MVEGAVLAGGAGGRGGTINDGWDRDEDELERGTTEAIPIDGFVCGRPPIPGMVWGAGSMEGATWGTLDCSCSGLGSLGLVESGPLVKFGGKGRFPPVD